MLFEFPSNHLALRVGGDCRRGYELVPVNDNPTIEQLLFEHAASRNLVDDEEGGESASR